MATTEQQQDFTLRANEQRMTADDAMAAVAAEIEAAFAARFDAAIEGFRLANAALV